MASMDVSDEVKGEEEQLVMEIDEEILDELKIAFEELEENDGKVADYEKLMDNDRVDEIAVKTKEKVIYKIARMHTEAKNTTEIMGLMKKNSEFFGQIPKAKTAKIVRSILAIVASIPDSVELQIAFCNNLVDWCNEEKRTFLRQRIEARLSVLLLDQKNTTKALKIVNKLLSELKKLDDKQMLTEVHLTESRIYHTVENIPKSKASLTASRSAANSIYVVPLLQAELDEMSGILCCEEGDNGTAYSYFQEAFDAYDNDKASAHHAVRVLKYMVLAKTLQRAEKEVTALFSSKASLKHAGPALEAVHAIAKAVKNRSLEDFKASVETHREHLVTDELISHHLTALYEDMFESNLLKIITPFSSVEIGHVAKLINLPVEVVERKLSQMILDHKFSGILDQGKGYLEVFEEAGEDKCMSRGVDIISSMESVVDTLMGRAKRHNKTVAM